MADILKEAGTDIKPGALSRMETGKRPGEPEVWGKIWQALRLPLRGLYEGLNLPTPTELPSGLIAELVEVVREMSEREKGLTLGYARHLPALLVAAESRQPLSLAAEESAEKA